MIALFNWFVKLTGWVFWAIVTRPKVHYEDKAVQSRFIRGGAIVMPNHLSVWDVAAMMCLFPTRTLRCVAAELMYEKNMVFTLFLKLLGTVRVDRNSFDFSFLSTCRTILEKGGVVELYPEARLPSPGQQGLMPFKPSITCLALESGAPIIPVYTDGNYFNTKRNHLVIGKPIDVCDWYDSSLSKRDNILAITERLRGKVYELSTYIEADR